MKYFLSFIMLFNMFTAVGSFQHAGIGQFGDECEKGVASASKDFSEKKYILLSYGLPFYKDWAFQEYYQNYVFNKYGITIGNGGCETSTETIVIQKK